jgi:hypothetical protein
MRALAAKKRRVQNSVMADPPHGHDHDPDHHHDHAAHGHEHHGHDHDHPGHGHDHAPHDHGHDHHHGHAHHLGGELGIVFALAIALNLGFVVVRSSPRCSTPSSC